MDKGYEFSSWRSPTLETCRKNGSSTFPSWYKKNNNEDQIQKIFFREKKTCEFSDNSCNAISKIGKIYTVKVLKEFLSVKTVKKWILKIL